MVSMERKVSLILFATNSTPNVILSFIDKQVDPLAWMNELRTNLSSHKVSGR